MGEWVGRGRLCGGWSLSLPPYPHIMFVFRADLRHFYRCLSRMCLTEQDYNGMRFVGGNQGFVDICIYQSDRTHSPPSARLHGCPNRFPRVRRYVAHVLAALSIGC